MTAVFDGLINIPSSDLNFKHGIEALNGSSLNTMLKKLNELQAVGEYHKGRIKAVEREIKKREKEANNVL
jgi:hypothetical protein